MRVNFPKQAKAWRLATKCPGRFAVCRHLSPRALYVRFTATVQIRPKFALIVAILACSALPASAAVPGISLTADGTSETVFDWRSGRCDDGQYPDAPARAYRDTKGIVHLFATHYDNRAFTGSGLDTVRIDCHSTYAARRDDDPEAYDDRVWLTSFHTGDGSTIIALGHAEYHGHLRPTQCPWRDYRSCWWNGVVGLLSYDGGTTFTRAPGVRSIVAALRGPYDPSVRRPVGYFSPSNMLEWNGGLYVFVFAEAYGEQKRGPCLLRTTPRGDPSSWRAWDGRDFTVSLSPAADPDGRSKHGVCTPVPGLGATVTSVVRRDGSDDFIALIAATRNEPEERTGIYFALSQDLLHWTPPRMLLEAPLMFKYRCEDASAYAYPALLDSASRSRNFESVGSSAWLYVTRFTIEDCKFAKARDLVRYRVRVSAPAER